jgi:hypothetical protein
VLALLNKSLSKVLIARQFDLEIGALWRLGKLFVCRRRHVPPDLDENCLHREVTLPGADAW